MLISLTVMAADDVSTYIPEKAKMFIPMLSQTQKQMWSEHPDPVYFASLIEQESCISLRHSKCWDPSSTLKTKRELGIGFTQVTKTFNSDGSIRFDTLSDMKRAYKTELKELTWENIARRPDLQFKITMLKSKDDFKAFKGVEDPKERLYFVDAAWNQGRGKTSKDRIQCGLKKNCDPDIWFGNVEMVKPLNAKPIYGKRTGWDISREHVTNVFKLRMEKYRPYFK